MPARGEQQAQLVHQRIESPVAASDVQVWLATIDRDAPNTLDEGHALCLHRSYASGDCESNSERSDVERGCMLEGRAMLWLWLVCMAALVHAQPVH